MEKLYTKFIQFGVSVLNAEQNLSWEINVGTPD